MHSCGAESAGVRADASRGRRESCFGGAVADLGHHLRQLEDWGFLVQLGERDILCIDDSKRRMHWIVRSGPLLQWQHRVRRKMTARHTLGPVAGLRPTVAITRARLRDPCGAVASSPPRLESSPT